MRTTNVNSFSVSRGAAVVILTALLTGCAGSGEDNPTSGRLPEAFPLDAYLGGFSAEQPGDTSEEQRQVEELIAACMKEQGFEYIPREPMEEEDIPQFEPDDREWVAEYGYGITTIGNGLAAQDTTDPNAALVEAMDDSERDSYFSALWGPPTAVEGGGPGAAVAAAPAGVGPGAFMSGSGAGCAGEAQTEIFGAQTQIDFAEYEDLFAAVAELEAKVIEDPRVAPGLQRWVDCMSDAGHPEFGNVAEAQDSIMQKWADLNGFEYHSGGPGGMAQGMTVTKDAADATPEPDQVEVAKLRESELSLALLDFDCATEYRAAVAQVRFELQTAFVADHLSELEKYRDAINGGK